MPGVEDRVAGDEDGKIALEDIIINIGEIGGGQSFADDKAIFLKRRQFGSIEGEVLVRKELSLFIRAPCGAGPIVVFRKESRLGDVPTYIIQIIARGRIHRGKLFGGDLAELSQGCSKFLAIAEYFFGLALDQLNFEVAADAKELMASAGRKQGAPRGCGNLGNNRTGMGPPIDKIIGYFELQFRCIS